MSGNRTLSSLSIVAPFFNEEAGLAAFYERLKAQLEKLDISRELIFVDDGSQDRTLELLNRIADADPRVTVLSLSRNFGHQTALTAGLDHATGEAVVVMDADLQHPPEALPDLIAGYEAGADVVYAVREHATKLGFIKRFTSTVYYAVMEYISDIQMVPGAADFRLMSSRAVAALRQMRETHRYLRGMVPWLGFPSAVIHYDQPARHAGRPSYTLRKSLRMARTGIFSFSTVPLQLVTWLGLSLTLLGALYLAYIVWVTLEGRTVPGWSSVIVAVLVIGGVQLLSLGVIAQYVGMLFEQGMRRPLYVLKQERLASEPAPDRRSGSSVS